MKPAGVSQETRKGVFVPEPIFTARLLRKTIDEAEKYARLAHRARGLAAYRLFLARDRFSGQEWECIKAELNLTESEIETFIQKELNARRVESQQMPESFTKCDDCMARD